MINPLTRGDAGAADRAVALLPQQPPLSQPAVPAHRGGAGRRRRWARRWRDSPTPAARSTRTRRIDRDAIFALKMEALEAIFDRFTGDARFDRYWTEQGEALTQFAAYCALAERHGKDWRRWPAEYRRPDGAEVARFVTEEARRVRFHAWLQWLLDEQLGGGGARDRASSTICPSASTSPAPTPGAGRICWPATSRSARRPTSSTPTARTGA